MRHARAAALAEIEGLLTTIRRVAALKERGPGIFYLRGKAFLHFHEDPAGLFADLRKDGDWVRFAVNTKAGQQRLVKSITALVSD